MRASLLRWELIGIPAIFLSGSALHFAYQLSGRLAVVAPFVAVNESVWEHLKLSFWPAVVYALVEYSFFGRHTVNFAIAKAAGVLLMPLLIVLLFYGYTALTGHHILWLDILLFFVAVAAGQLASYGLLRFQQPSGRWNIVGLGAVLLVAVGFTVFTFATPRLAIFKDSPTGTYGVVR